MTIPPHVAHAAAGLTSYRYPSLYGWVMIGARDDQEAQREAARSLAGGMAYMERLERWDDETGSYLPVKGGETAGSAPDGQTGQRGDDEGEGGQSATKAAPMSHNLAPARARESAESWLARRRQTSPVPPRADRAFIEQAMLDAFMAGEAEGLARGAPKPDPSLDVAPFQLEIPGEDSAAAHGQPIGVIEDRDPEPIARCWEGDGPSYSHLKPGDDVVRLSSGDPRFDPAKAVTINGYAYQPTKGSRP